MRPGGRDSTAVAEGRREPGNVSGGRKNAGTGSGQDGFRIGTIAGTHLALTSSQPRHTRVSPQSPERKRHERPTAIRQAHPSRRSFGTARRIRTWSGSHLGSTLEPGRAVLTRGVSRRSGSVACIRADASPTEVLAGFMLPRVPRLVKPGAQPLRHFGPAVRGQHPRLFAWSRGLPSKAWPILCRTPESQGCSTGCTPNRRTRCRCCAKNAVSSIGR